MPPSLDGLRSVPGGADWLDSAPARVVECVRRWSLRLGDPFPRANASVVYPAETATGAAVVLKVQFPHHESEHEAEALRLWDGHGAVRLLDHDPQNHALLLERCDPGEHLSEEDPEVALDVLIGLVPRLWTPATKPFTRLDDEAAWWADGLAEKWERAGRPFPAGLLDTAVAMLRDLAGSSAESVLLHQDLHADNVLRAEREPWLVIDPKPLAGDRAFSVAPIARSYELGHSREHVIRRFDRLTSELDLDRDRARAWTVGQTLAWAFEGDAVLDRHVATARWLAAHD